MPDEETTGTQPFNEPWALLQGRAWNLLENSENIEPTLREEDGERIGQPRLRLWDDNLKVRPNFLTVFDPPENAVVLIAREATWEQAKDRHRMMEVVKKHDPVAFPPTISVRDAWIPRKEIMLFLKQASAFAVPLICLQPRAAAPGDARTRGLEFFSPNEPPALLRLQWSDLTPREWDPVLKWLGKLKAFLLTCLDHPKCRISHSAS
jgi:hypothetical protein